MEEMNEFSNFYLPTQYFNNVCRVCLSEHNVLVPIEEVILTHNLNPNGTAENVNLKTIFQKFCNVEVTVSDGKPQKICECCMNIVGKAFNFFQLFLYSNALLDEKIEECKLAQEKTEPNDDDQNNDSIVPAPEESFFVDVINKNYSNEYYSEDTSENIIVSIESKPSVSALKSQNVGDTDNERKRTLKKYIRSPQKLSNFLLDHDYGVLDPLKEGALKILMKINQRFKRRATRKQKIVRPRIGEVRQIEHQNDLFRCRFCLKRFHGITEVIKHLKEEHQDTKRCILCPTKFIKTSCFMYHVAAHSPNGLVCRTCRLYFETKESLDHHMENVDHTNIKKCPKCQKMFKSSYQVRQHINTVHLKKENFQCGTCGKMFIYRYNLRRHEKNTHGIEKKFLCQICGKKFTTNYHMKLHMQRFHKLHQGLTVKKYPVKKEDSFVHKKYNNPQFECKFCPKKFYNSWSFFTHCEVHPEFKEYLCDICNGTFEARKEYVDHYNTHEKFKCPYPDCVKLFPLKRLALRHKYKHTEPLSCDVCGALFRIKNALQDHMNVHTGEKPYICEHCGQGFKQKAHLRTHIVALHGGKKPWQCRLCDKAFSYKGGLTCHMRSHTGEKPFPCPFCNRMFRDTTGRHKHVKSDHPAKMKEFLIYKEKYQEEEIRRVESGSHEAKDKEHDTESSDDSEEQ